MRDFYLAVIGSWLMIIAMQSCGVEARLRDINSAIRDNTAEKCR